MAHMTFRSARLEDIKEIKNLIQELADYEKMGDHPELTEEDLARDSGLISGTPIAHYYILELNGDSSEQTTKTIGFAACCISYSSWIGKIYFLDNFYIKPEYQRIQADVRLFNEIAAKALEHGCKRLDVNVLAWDRRRRFYEKMGATDNTKSEQRHFYRLHEKSINVAVKEIFKSSARNE